MIRRLNCAQDAFFALCAQDVFGTRTRGYFDTYGTERNETAFYVQTHDDQLTAALSDVCGQASLTVTPQADDAELAAFVRFLAPQSLLCERETAKRLGFPDEDSGSVMEYFGTAYSAPADRITPQDARFSYRAVYDLLTRCGFDCGAYASWLGDIALRVQRGTAQIVTLQRDGRVVCTASMLFAAPGQAYLGAVATDPAFRGQGLAGDLVRYLTTLRPTARILCKSHRVSFYTSLGFQKIGEFSTCHFLR